MSGIACEYAIFVTIIDKGVSKTIVMYARDRDLAQALADTFREIRKLMVAGIGKPITHVDFAKL